jgi:uncharacterized protein
MTPTASPFLTARWLGLAMVNYEVDPALLGPRVPAGTELDVFSGRCFVSIVGFQFVDTRVLGVAIPFHKDFEEVNLRFYVKRLTGGQVRRGVVFVKEIVPRRAIAWVANALYNEKYVALAMSHQQQTTDRRRTLSYSWRHNGTWSRLGVTFDGEPYLPEESSEEAFITEHYWGYTAQRDGSTREYQVEHPRWNVWQVQDLELACDVATLYGAEFARFIGSRPSSCFVADGSAVVVRRGLAVK